MMQPGWAATFLLLLTFLSPFAHGYADGLFSFTIHSPNSSESYSFVPGLFGGAIMSGGPFPLVTPTPPTGCAALNAISSTGQPVQGSWVLIDRGGGNCDFQTKVANAQQAGAIGVIIANCEPSLCGAGFGLMASTNEQASLLTIPALALPSYEDGKAIKAFISSTKNVNITFTPAGNLAQEEWEALQQIAQVTTIHDTDVAFGTRRWETLLQNDTRDPCHTPRLEGVWCENGHVVSILLVDNYVTGPFVSAWGRFPRLRILDLSLHRLSGPMPCEFGQLTELKEARLHAEPGGETGITSIPPCIGNLTSLRLLQLQDNKITSVATELWSLPALEILTIENNQIVGTLPSDLFAQMPNLQTLEASHNKFYGELPEFRLASNIWRIDLGHNEFVLPDDWVEGSDWLDNMPTTLYWLDLSYNKLRGVLPRLWGTATLVYIDLSNNEFYGQIPSSWWQYSLWWTMYLYLQVWRLFKRVAVDLFGVSRLDDICVVPYFCVCLP